MPILAFFLLISILAIIPGCTSSNKIIDDKILVKNFKITNMTCGNVDGSSGISGQLINSDNNFYKSISVKYSIYDENDVRIDYGFVRVYNIQPYETVRFFDNNINPQAGSLCQKRSATINGIVYPPSVDPWTRKCQNPKNSDIIVIDYFNYSTSYGDPLINGIIENTGSNWYDTVVIEAKIFDDNGVRIDEAGDWVESIEGHERVGYSLVINDYVKKKILNHENVKFQINASIYC